MMIPNAEDQRMLLSIRKDIQTLAENIKAAAEKGYIVGFSIKDGAVVHFDVIAQTQIKFNLDS